MTTEARALRELQQRRRLAPGAAAGEGDLDDVPHLLRAIATVHAAESNDERLSKELREYHADAAKRCRQAATALAGLREERKRLREAIERACHHIEGAAPTRPIGSIGGNIVSRLRAATE